MLLLDFYFRGVKHRELLKDHHLSLICYSSSLSSNSLVAVIMENHHYLIWKINSHSIQAIVVLRQSEHMLNDWAFSPLVCRLKKLVRGLIPLDMGTSLKSQFQSSEHLICSATFQKRLWCHNSKPLALRTELSRSHQNVYVRCFVTSTDNARGSAHRAVH